MCNLINSKAHKLLSIILAPTYLPAELPLRLVNLLRGTLDPTIFFYGVTLAQLVKASVGQADVQRFEPHLGHN